MSNVSNDSSFDEISKGETLKVRFVNRQGDTLGEHFYNRDTVEEARSIPYGNRVPYLNKENWRLLSISPDGTLWTVDNAQ